MHGALRFLLAILVALSHLGVLLPNYNQGVFAVVLFYILAGMVSHKLIINYFQNQPLLYYLDRIKRIYPFYIIVLLIAVAAYLSSASSYFISKEPSLLDYLSNLFIIPLSYYMYTQQDTFTLLPPAWSLGVELQFYILAPFLLTSTLFFRLAFISSFIVFILASIGILNTDYFGYRLIIGVIFIFLLGSLIQRAIKKDKEAIKTLKFIYFMLIVLFIYINHIAYKAAYNYETISALLIGIPLLYVFKTPVPVIIDKYLGALSYGVFLLHFPMLWLLEVYYAKSVSAYLVLFASILVSVIIDAIIKIRIRKLL